LPCWRDVKAGSKLLEDAGSTINEIVGSVQRGAGIVSELPSASEEQSAGIEQLNRVVGQMDRATH
jgi:methyl-accepting chemotaxis protein